MTLMTFTIDVQKAPEQWVVYEHYMPLPDGQPPQLIYIGHCKFTEIARMAEARSNSDWQTCTDVNPVILVNVVSLHDDRYDALNTANMRIHALPDMPRCNLYGFDRRGLRRPLECSNGQIYGSQCEAAQALGLPQSSISAHLQGRLAHVKGYKFKVKDI